MVKENDITKEIKPESYKGYNIMFVYDYYDIRVLIYSIKPTYQRHEPISDYHFRAQSKKEGLEIAKNWIDNATMKNDKIIVGKNMITFDKDSNGWIVEVRQYVDNGTPMYSVWDVIKRKEDAIRIAKILTPENEFDKHIWYVRWEKNIFVKN